jgi:DNA-binding SARP family transcriptional activator
MEFFILGPLEIASRDGPLELRAAKQQALLGVLLLHANEVVPVPRLVSELWGGSPPTSAAKAVQGYVSDLRKLLGRDVIATKPTGYCARLEPDCLDAARFRRLADEGTALIASDPDRAADACAQALSVWRGPVLEGLELRALARIEADGLEEQRLAVLERRIEAELALGRHAELVAELRRLVAEHPYRERLRAHLMLSLYRSGRQADALAAFQAARRTLDEELGLAPGADLRRLEQRMLAQAPELDPPVVSPSRPPLAPVPPARRLLTVVVAEVVGANALGERLDAESAHAVLDRCSALCAEALERHGGSIETFAGEAVVATFGLQELHEDDAVRAVRAAVELRAGVSELSDELRRDHGMRLSVKAGIDSGEVFAAAGVRRGTFAAGDAVGVAAGLGAAAAPGEILLGEGAHRLVASEIRADAVGSIAVSGRVAAVTAWRVVELHSPRARLLRAPATPFVDRADELAALERALAQASAARGCRLVTVLGSPGIGKTRLVREFVARLGSSATVVVGRCPSYGAGITLVPLAEIVRGLEPDPASRIAAALEDEERAEEIERVVLATAGVADGDHAADVTSWAFRRLFEALAREQPLVGVFEDVHWAEPTLLDLLDSLAGFSSGAPILLVCLARPELLERRPVWAAPQPNRTLLALEPLPEANAHDLVDHLVPEGIEAETRARIIEKAEGNPLFLEQLLAVQAGSDAVLPPSVQAVLAARIERLDPAERTALRHAAVEGRTFHRGVLVELLPESERAALDANLIALVHKQLLRPDRPQLAGDDAFRFAHVLIREAAYAGLPKQLRAELHERVARRLEERTDSQDEIVGYHLEQAHRCLAELGPLDEGARALARTAGDKLLASGLRALRGRGDLPAAANLLERASALLPVDDRTRLAAQPQLAQALIGIGRLARAEAVLDDAVEQAGAAGDERSEAYALLARAELQLHSDAAQDLEGVQAEIVRLAGVFERLGSSRGLARCWLELGKLRAWLGSCEAGTEAIEHAFAVAEAAGHSLGRHRVGIFLILAITYGPTPVDDAIRRVDRVLRDHDLGADAAAVALCCEAWMQSMQGRFEEARRKSAAGRGLLREHGVALYLGAVSMLSGPVELLAEDPAAAERDLRAGYEALERFGETNWRATVAAHLAEAVRAQGRVAEALELTAASRRLAARDDFLSQTEWRTVRARTLAALGRLDEAERPAREAVQLVEPTDYLFQRASTLHALGEVLLAGGKDEDGGAALAEAVRLYEQKGATLCAERAGALARGVAAPAS